MPKDITVSQISYYLRNTKKKKHNYFPERIYMKLNNLEVTSQ